jgi:hypothetical protein
MNKVIVILVRVVWLSLCIASLVYAHIGYQGNADWRLEENLGFEMIILSFPASVIVVAGIMLLGAGLQIFGLALPASSRVEMTATWFLFTTAGSMQWFFLLPKLWRNRQRVRR